MESITGPRWTSQWGEIACRCKPMTATCRREHNNFYIDTNIAFDDDLEFYLIFFENDIRGISYCLGLRKRMLMLN